MKKISQVSLFLMTLLAYGCNEAPTDTIYYNGDIVTMEDPLYVEAIRTQDGIITHAGSLADIEKLKTSTTQMVDLHGKTMIPAFIDTHSHIMHYAQTLASAQLGDAKTLDEIKILMKDHIEKTQPKPGALVVGSGYDHNFLAEKQHPTRALLDSVSTEYPIIISHASGHMGVANSKALELMGLTKETPNPDGGVIGHDVNGELNGYLEENAFIQLSQKIATPMSDQDMKALVKQAEADYLKNGISTAQEALAREYEFNILKDMANEGALDMDIITFIDLKNSKKIANTNMDRIDHYRNRLKIGGYKIFLDGSPQGKTAWLSEPYLNSGDYAGYPIFTDDEVVDFVKTSLNDRVQLQAHANGDAAAAQYIRAFRTATADNPTADNYRPVMIHSQVARPDQYPELAELKIIPSIFVDHVYYWGDVHIKNLGLDRASNISAAHSALDNNLPFTFHQDSPVLPPDMIESVWVATNRITKDGVLLGPDQRIDPIDALRAVTLNAAYQNKEEASKGSLAPGKRADLVILSDNPLKINKSKIRNIQVLETIKDGVPVYVKK